MEEVQLNVQLRKQIGSRKVKIVRREDYLPAVVYGDEKATTPVKVKRRDYEIIMRSHRGQSVLFHLNVLEGEKKLRDYSAIIKEEQLDPVKDTVLHIDFLRISLKKEIEVKVPVRVKGDAIGVKKENGSLDQHIRELDVICLPINIPDKLEVDVSALNIGDALYVKDIKLPEGVRTKHDMESIVVTVVPPMKEEAQKVEETDLRTEPEVIKEKKKEKTEEEVSADAKKEQPKAEAKKEEKK